MQMKRIPAVVLLVLVLSIADIFIWTYIMQFKLPGGQYRYMKAQMQFPFFLTWENNRDLLLVATMIYKSITFANVRYVEIQTNLW